MALVVRGWCKNDDSTYVVDHILEVSRIVDNDLNQCDMDTMIERIHNLLAKNGNNIKNVHTILEALDRFCDTTLFDR